MTESIHNHYHVNYEYLLWVHSHSSTTVPNRFALCNANLDAMAMRSYPPFLLFPLTSFGAVERLMQRTHFPYLFIIKK